MKLFTHFTRGKRTSFQKNDIEDFLSENPKDNLESILNEGVLYGSRYQSFFCNKGGYYDQLPFMISVTENRLHEHTILIEHRYSHGIIFAPGVIEAAGAKKINYLPPSDLHNMMDEKDKLSKDQRREWLLETGYLYNVSALGGREYWGENEYRIKLFPEIHHVDEKKGVGLQLAKKDIALLIVPEPDREYFETKFLIPTVPQEKIKHLAEARANPMPGVVHEFPDDDFFLFEYANSFLEKINASYRWKKDNDVPVRISA